MELFPNVAILEARAAEDSLRKTRAALGVMVPTSTYKTVDIQDSKTVNATEYGTYKTVNARIWHMSDSQDHNMTHIRQSRPEARAAGRALPSASW